MENGNVPIHNDEPTREDLLNRDQYAEVFAHLIETCNTPLVVGLYGSWGMGKTSFMQLIERKLDTKNARAIWFNPWQHQFDENPIIALAHTLVSTLGSQPTEETKELLTVIATAFSSQPSKLITGLTAKDVLELEKIHEDENFQVHEARARLREFFKKIIEKARGEGLESKRLVFFIDDLDRCMPDCALRVLEAFKLYLDIKGCVYLIGADRTTLEKSIKHRYGDLDIKESDYLDKVVHLPFSIPPIEPQFMDSLIEPFLSEELQSCRELLGEGLGDNPRQVKRFINALTLNHQLAKPRIPNYDPMVLSLLLLIQLIQPRLYHHIARDTNLLKDLRDNSEEKEDIYDEFLTTNDRLRNALTLVDCPNGELLRPYIYLTGVAGIITEYEQKPTEISLQAVLEKHKLWLQTNGDEGRQANLWKANLKGADLRGAVLRGANLGGADLEGASLKGADLIKALLAGANLKKAGLKGADLRGAGLRGAIFKGADLGEADLRGADLRRADLRGAKGINEKRLSMAGTLHEVQLDTKLMEQIMKHYPHLLEKPKQ